MNILLIFLFLLFANGKVLIVILSLVTRVTLACEESLYPKGIEPVAQGRRAVSTIALSR